MHVTSRFTDIIVVKRIHQIALFTADFQMLLTLVTVIFAVRQK